MRVLTSDIFITLTLTYGFVTQRLLWRQSNDTQRYI